MSSRDTGKTTTSCSFPPKPLNHFFRKIKRPYSYLASIDYTTARKT
jgi:hypothetical protein